MLNKIILVAGMSGTGKSTFARLLADAAGVCLISYDDIKRENPGAAYARFWQTVEESMAASKKIVVDYIFSSQHHVIPLEEMTAKYEYDALTFLLDCKAKIAYSRYAERNRLEGADIRPDCEFDAFAEVSTKNRDFEFGEVVKVCTDSFEAVDFDALIKIGTDFWGRHV